jgi:hypothetical protein
MTMSDVNNIDGDLAESEATRSQREAATKALSLLGKSPTEAYQLTPEDFRLARWCVLTVSKGFVAAPDGQSAAADLFRRLDAIDTLKASAARLEAELAAEKARADARDAAPFAMSCGECHQLIESPSDAYAVEWLEWYAPERKSVVHSYPGTFHGRCTTKARARLDAERTRGR